MSTEIAAVETSKKQVFQEWLVAKIAEQLLIKSHEVDVSTSLTNYGLDSIVAFTVVGDLEDWLGTELPATLLWDYPTIEEISRYLASLDITPT